MNILTSFLVVLLLSFQVNAQKFKDGDIIFQSSYSQQSAAIEEATQSPYSHCGIIFYENNVAYVYEAVQPVGKRTLESWIESGVNEKYVVKRLKDSTIIGTNERAEMKKFILNQFGKNYDGVFNWSDKEMYCSELVYKCYLNACQIKLTTPLPLRDFNIDGPIVRKVMKQRYGNEIPYDELMVSPDQLFKSSKLININ
jgi:hypothetical protein